MPVTMSSPLPHSSAQKTTGGLSPQPLFAPQPSPPRNVPPAGASGVGLMSFPINRESLQHPTGGWSPPARVWSVREEPSSLHTIASPQQLRHPRHLATQSPRAIVAKHEQPQGVRVAGSSGGAKVCGSVKPEFSAQRAAQSSTNAADFYKRGCLLAQGYPPASSSRAAASSWQCEPCSRVSQLRESVRESGSSVSHPSNVNSLSRTSFKSFKTSLRR